MAGMHGHLASWLLPLWARQRRIQRARRGRERLVTGLVTARATNADPNRATNHLPFQLDPNIPSITIHRPSPTFVHTEISFHCSRKPDISVLRYFCSQDQRKLIQNPSSSARVVAHPGTRLPSTPFPIDDGDRKAERKARASFQIQAGLCKF
uniref:Uncharacterized protein n=1 Tax=Setaria viridis TaxID=4556 RepID=A0A4U6TXS7_SETVI|nr:hypothetical protein SEVIR_7G247600v2 [Setaria viridis]